MEDLKSQLVQLLTALDYNADKEKFVNTFLTICHRQAMNELIKKLPKDTTEQLKNELTSRKYPSLEAALKQYLTPGQYNEALKMAVSQNIKEAMAVILPTLNKDQLTKLDIYLATL